MTKGKKHGLLPIVNCFQSELVRINAKRAQLLCQNLRTALLCLPLLPFSLRSSSFSLCQHRKCLRFPDLSFRSSES